MIAQTNAVKQVGLRLAGNLELAALGRQRLAFGVFDEIGVADETMNILSPFLRSTW